MTSPGHDAEDRSEGGAGLPDGERAEEAAGPPDHRHAEEAGRPPDHRHTEEADRPPTAGRPDDRAEEAGGLPDRRRAEGAAGLPAPGHPGKASPLPTGPPAPEGGAPTGRATAQAQAQAQAIRLGPRSLTALALISATGIAAFGWPLVASTRSTLVAHAQDAPWLFAALLPLLLGVVVAVIGDTGMDAKAIAMIGVLAAAGAALRPLGAGTAGIEPMFFLMVLSGRVLGPGFGFVLGAVTMFASALLTGGVGPWLPFQMLAMGWVAMGAGLLPGANTLRGRRELCLVASYGAIAAVLYGTVMNLQGWPYIGGLSSGISFVPGDPLPRNLARFAAYCLATSLGWDLPRAAVTVVLTLLLGATVLKALRRATRRAAFSAPVSFRKPQLPLSGRRSQI